MVRVSVCKYSSETRGDGSASHRYFRERQQLSSSCCYPFFNGGSFRVGELLQFLLANLPQLDCFVCGIRRMRVLVSAIVICILGKVRSRTTPADHTPFLRTLQIFHVHAQVHRRYTSDYSRTCASVLARMCLTISRKKEQSTVCPWTPLNCVDFFLNL